MSKKLLFLIDRNKQVLPNSGDCKFTCASQSFVVDFVGDVSQVKRDAYYLNDGKLVKEEVFLDVCEHFKKKNLIMKINKRRRDPTRKGQCASFSLIAMKEVENGN